MLKKTVQKFHWILASQFGLDFIRLFTALKNFPRFLNQFLQFKKSYIGAMTILPCLHDRVKEAGEIRNEYFWQDLLVAKMIFDASPEKHVDIGSRLDGFVAHLTAFREVEVFDIRPIGLKIPNVVFKQCDFTKPINEIIDYCDSLSCLHALEHFGLGRYGDPIDPLGPQKAFSNMAKILKREGTFYLSVPIGIERVEFNAHRIFDPSTILLMAKNNLLSLFKAYLIKNGDIKEFSVLDEDVLSELKSLEYGLGLFIFRKQNIFL